MSSRSVTIGVQLWSIRDSLKTPEDFAKSMARVAAMGYAAVEPCLPAVVSPAEMKKILDANGLKACGSHGPAKRIIEDVDGLIADHRTLGCRLPGTGGAPKDMRTADGYRQFAGLVERAGEKLRKAGMTYIYHNHTAEFMKFDGRNALEIMAEAAPSGALGFEIDVAWVQGGGADPAAWIRKLGKRVPAIHCKDLGIGADGEQHSMPVGLGNLNWPAVLAAAMEVGVDWFVVEVEEEHVNGDPFESLKVSIENLREWGVE
jgi:sugar phosphate isomerase/epimerase